MAASVSVPVTSVASAAVRRRCAVRERVLDALAAFPGELEQVNVDFVELGGAVVSMHGHRVGAVEALRDLLGVVDEAPAVRVIDSPRGAYEVVGYAEGAELRGGIALDWYPSDPSEHSDEGRRCA